MVLADPSQIHQIGMNLITNAYHALENAGGTISIKLKQTATQAPESSEMNHRQNAYAERGGQYAMAWPSRLLTDIVDQDNRPDAPTGLVSLPISARQNTAARNGPRAGHFPGWPPHGIGR
jgi:hypothetical protein